MGKVNLYAPFAGVKDGLALLALLQDKKRLKEVLGVVKLLDERIKEINEAIEVYGKANQIDGLLNAARQKSEEAERALAAAQDQAAEVQAEAQATVEANREALDGQAAAVAARENRVSAAEAAFKRKSEAQEAAMAEREANAAALGAQATARLAEAEETNARYQAMIDDVKKRAAAA